MFERLVRRGIVSIGPGTYGAMTVHAYALAIAELPAVRIGGYCSIGPESCAVVNGGHRPDLASTFPLHSVYDLADDHAENRKMLDGPMVIGSDVWIGARSLLIGGVEIGHGAIVGGGAVVTKDVRPYAIVVGNPAREVRRRFDDSVIERLLGLAWWDLPESDVVTLADQLTGPLDIDRLTHTVIARRQLAQAAGPVSGRERDPQ